MFFPHEPNERAGVQTPDNNYRDVVMVPDDANEEPNISLHNDDGNKTVAWADVSGDNTINDGPSVWWLKKRSDDEGCHFNNIGEDMNNGLMAQTTYI